MMSKIILSIVLALIFAPSLVMGEDLSKSFPGGTGSKFAMRMKDGTTAEVSIYITSAKKSSLSIEYFITTVNSFLPVKIWQQFVLNRPDSTSSLVLQAGYIKVPEWDKAEELTSEHLKGYDGVQMNDFLFNKQEELDKSKVGEETLTIQGGTTKTTHYRKSNQGQVVDFWIADAAKPIGLVKLESVNEKKIDQNYSLELLSLLKNVKPTIEPDKAVPLSKKGRDLLSSSVVKH